MSSPPRSTASERYRLISPIGEGGMGRVWLARDEVLHRDVAVKEVVPPSGLTESEGEQASARGLREARAIARLNHPNVVRIFDVVATPPRPWIVMEYVKSRSLQDRIALDGPIPVAEVARIGLGILSALQAAHRAGVLHRDVKPSNVLLSEDGRVVLTDFGLATLAGDATLTRSGLILGSPAYIAPERARQGITGPESDLWSLGATLYAAAEGRAPYHRSTAMATLTALVTEPPDPALLAGPLSPVLDALLDKNPATRMAAPQAARLLRRLAGTPRQPERQPWRAQRERGSAQVAPARPESPPAAVPPAAIPPAAVPPAASIAPTARLVPPVGRPVAPPPPVRPVAERVDEPATVVEPSPIVRPAGSASPASGIPPQRTPDAEPEPSGSRSVRPGPEPGPELEPGPGSSAPAGSSAASTGLAGTESTSTDSTSTDSTSTGPANGGSASTESAGPESTAPTASELAGSESAGSTLAEPAPAGFGGAESGGAESSGAESGSAQAESGSASAEPEPDDSGDEKQASAAAPPEPPDQQAATPQAAFPQGATTPPATTPPATTPPATAQPGAGKPTAAQPTATKSTAAQPTAAQPTAAQPTTAKSATTKPTTANLSSGKPPVAKTPVAKSPAVPARPARWAAASPVGSPPAAPPVGGAPVAPAGVRAGGPARKPLFAVIGGLIVIVIVAVVVVIALHHGSSGSSGAALAPPSRTPSAVASASPSAVGSPAATGSAPPSVPASAPASAPAGDAAGTGGTTLPAGWQMHHDPTGFSVAVPDGWTISHSGTIVYFHDPSGGRLLGVDQTNQPKSDPVQDWTTQAQYRVSHGDFPGYQQIKIAAVPYHVKAADWEFTYNKSGTRTHVINRGAVFGPHQAYGFYWSTPESVWSANLSNFELIMSTFQGKTG